MSRKSLEIIEVDIQQAIDKLHLVEKHLSTEDAQFFRRILESYDYVTELIADKNTSLARLRKLMFGAKTESAKNVIGSDTGNSPAAATEVDNASDASKSDGSASEGDQPRPAESSDDSPTKRSSKPGHGRRRADEYLGATQIDIRHATLTIGDNCPECLTGTLYEKTPSALVRLVGQAPLGATVYRLERLRCHLCGQVFMASSPQDLGTEKYDVSAASMIALLKYGSGLPFNRLEQLQQHCEIPLAASTQWEIVENSSSLLLPVYDELIRQAAQGDVVHNDDTTVRILELMGKRAEKNPPADDQHDPQRTGLFTSGVIAMREGQQVALFFSGRKHAGENLATVLKQREAEREAPILMCDGLARNLPKELETIVANCLVHARRKFVDIYDRFSDECRHLIESLGKVYHHDQIARDKNLTPLERLDFHQRHSQPIMDSLHLWLKSQIDQKQVEPNSALGEAIQYMLKRWGRLTVFLHKPGAPLDNNSCERLLKKAILHRKNALFFKTQNGARIGDLYMSLIYTCQLNGANALDYLNQLQTNAASVSVSPQQWMPWNYKENELSARKAA